MGAVYELPSLTGKLNELKAQGKRIVSTNGCFDILHVGHIRFLQAAKSLGDILVIGLNSDASVKRLKGPTRPVIGQADRAEILAALACVDYVCIFEEDTPVEFLKGVRSNVHAKGADYKPTDLAETPVVESFGGEVNIIELVPGKSTTSIVRLISGERV